MLEVIRPYPEAEQIVMRHSYKLIWNDPDSLPLLSGVVESDLTGLIVKDIENLQDHFKETSSQFMNFPANIKNETVEKFECRGEDDAKKPEKKVDSNKTKPQAEKKKSDKDETK